MNLVTMWSRASKNLNLTPGERALVRFIKLAIIAAFVAMLPAAAQYQAGQTIDWLLVLHTGISSGLSALAFSLEHYFTSQGDPALAQAVDAGDTLVQRLVDRLAPAGVMPPASAAPAPAAPAANAVTSNASAEPAPAVAAS